MGAYLYYLAKVADSANLQESDATERAMSNRFWIDLLDVQSCRKMMQDGAIMMAAKMKLFCIIDIFLALKNEEPKV